VPALLAEDASELYAKNQYNLLALFVKDNVVSIDWADEILAKTVLTHAGVNKGAETDKAAADAEAKAAVPKPKPKPAHAAA